MLFSVSGIGTCGQWDVNAEACYIEEVQIT